LKYEGSVVRYLPEFALTENIREINLKSLINEHAMYVSRNIEARSCNDRCCEKAMSITQLERVYL